MSNRTPEQAYALRLYRSERRQGNHPLDAIHNVKATIAITLMNYAMDHGELPDIARDQYRAVEQIQQHIRVRDGLNLKVIAS